MNITKYCKLEWKVQVTRESLQVEKTLNSQRFDMNFGSGKLRWCLKFQRKAEENIETQKMDDDEELDFVEMDNNPEELNVDDDENCGILLSLLDSSCADSLEFKNSLLTFRFYLINADHEEKLIYCGSRQKLKLFGFGGPEGGWGTRISWNQIFDEKKKFISNDTLTLSVSIEIHVRSDDTTEPLRPFENLLNSSFFSDFSIVCNDREISAHRAILYTFSPLFSKMLQDQMNMSKSNKVTINDIDGKVVSRILRYIYTGQLEPLKGIKDKDLLYAADKFELIDLKKKIVDSMSIQLNMKNVFETLELADRFHEEVLIRNCIVFLKMHRKKLSESIGSINISYKLLVKIIESVMKEPGTLCNKLKLIWNINE